GGGGVLWGGGAHPWGPGAPRRRADMRPAVTRELRQGPPTYQRRGRAFVPRRFISKSNPPCRSNSVGASADAHSMASRRRLVATPPGAEKPPVLPPAATTRWHGTMIGQGFCPIASPTPRASGSPSCTALAP